MRFEDKELAIDWTIIATLLWNSPSDTLKCNWRPQTGTFAERQHNDTPLSQTSLSSGVLLRGTAAQRYAPLPNIAFKWSFTSRHGSTTIRPSPKHRFQVEFYFAARQQIRPPHKDSDALTNKIMFHYFHI